MAIFNKSDTESNTTIIAVGTKIDGDFNLDCKLHIDGEVMGKVNSTNIVSIGVDGSVKGELISHKLIVSGTFEGTADCDSIELLKDGKIIGKIISKDLMIESNSIFEGESQLKKNDNKKVELNKKDSASKNL
jgi:cytoskeletal protein CcmA (bactofilin family)